MIMIISIWGVMTMSKDNYIKTITVRLLSSQYEEIAKTAEWYGVSISDIIRQLIKQYLEGKIDVIF